MKLGLAALLALGLSLAGCTSDSARGANTGPLVFESEPAAGGAVVFLRERPSLVPNRVGIDVVARGAGDLHGVAFRVKWDPSAVAFISAEAGEKWSKTALAIAKEGTPGQLAVAWTEKGEVGIDASSEVVLGSFLFEARSRSGTPITFKTERSTAVDKKGAPVTIAWRGGTIAAR